MIAASELKTGTVFEYDGQIWEVLDYQMHRMSQSKSSMRTTLKSLSTGAVVERSFATQEKFRDVPVTKRELNYSYDEGQMSVFMDNETYEQISFPREKLGDQAQFLQDNMMVLGVYVDEKLTGIQLPANVVLEVTSSEPGVKGDSVSNMNKKATLSTGLEISVPLFVNQGEFVRVDTRTKKYIERVKQER
jgi:elongation factor P